DAPGLFGREGESFVRLRTDRTIGVIPSIMNAPVDQLAQPGLGEEVVDVALAETRGDAGEQFVLETVVETPERAVEDIFAAASFVGDHLGALDGDQRSGVADLAERPGLFLRDHLPIRKNL